MLSLTDLRIGLVGPLPPPSGGMANQTEQLSRLLRADGAGVELVQVNPPYRPRWVGHIRGVRALFRLIPYILKLVRVARRVDLFHIMANSGWAWHLVAAPAVWVARFCGIPAIVNYRGGEAGSFLDKSFFLIKPTLKAADAIVVPSAFLEKVFARKAVRVTVVPNIIDLGRFTPSSTMRRPFFRPDSVNIFVARNLEPLYDIETALRAFQVVRHEIPEAKLRVAGSGPEEQKLIELSRELGIGESVTFLGRISNENMPELYRSSDIAVNSSLVDNMPISILEALASGVPVVSTNVGGIPVLVEDGKTALLVPPRDPRGMAEAVLALVRDPIRYSDVRDAGMRLVRRYAWTEVRGQWIHVYAKALDRPIDRLNRYADA